MDAQSELSSILGIRIVGTKWNRWNDSRKYRLLWCERAGVSLAEMEEKFPPATPDPDPLPSASSKNKGSGKSQPALSPQGTSIPGVGSALKSILAKKGIKSNEGCQCNSRAKEMDANGLEWCEKNKEKIVGWLMEEAGQRFWLKPYLMVFPGDAKRRAKQLIEEAIAEAKKAISLRWQYGITTVPERAKLLPNTLESLGRAGFINPWIFVDGASDSTPIRKELGASYLVTVRPIRQGVVGNWFLSLWELYLQDAFADRYAIFQDDLVCCRNLRAYLDRCEYPGKAYLNLFTYDDNETLVEPLESGTWVEAGIVENNPNKRQTGRGALALVFDNQAARTLLSSESFVNKPRAVKKPRRKYYLDGGIVAAMNKAGYREYIHSPSLVQHNGKESTIGNQWKGLADVARSFPGEDFDALDLLK